MKRLPLAILTVFFALLVVASFSLPQRGRTDPADESGMSPVGSSIASDYYIEHAYEETHTDNIVTAVLADYRAFDTLGETLVVFVAGVACATLMGRIRRKP